MTMLKAFSADLMTFQSKSSRHPHKNWRRLRLLFWAGLVVAWQVLWAGLARPRRRLHLPQRQPEAQRSH